MADSSGAVLVNPPPPFVRSILLCNSHPGGVGSSSRPSTDSLKRDHEAFDGHEAVPGMALQFECGAGSGSSLPAVMEDKVRRRRWLKGAVLGAIAEIGWRFCNQTLTACISLLRYVCDLRCLPCAVGKDAYIFVRRP